MVFRRWADLVVLKNSVAGMQLVSDTVGCRDVGVLRRRTLDFRSRLVELHHSYHPLPVLVLLAAQLRPADHLQHRFRPLQQLPAGVLKGQGILVLVREEMEQLRQLFLVLLGPDLVRMEILLFVNKRLTVADAVQLNGTV